MVEDKDVTVLVDDLRNAAVLVGQIAAGAFLVRKLEGDPAAGSGDRGVRVWVLKLVLVLLAVRGEGTVPLEGS